MAKPKKSTYTKRRGKFAAVKQLHINLDKDDRAKLERIAKKNGKTVSQVIRDAIHRASV